MFQSEQYSPLYDLKGCETEEMLRERIHKLIQQNKNYRSKVKLLDDANTMFNHLYEGLNEEELQEVHDKLSIMVKAIRSRVYR
jgi:ATP-dependent exoDNAse (exonuclease V) beta subunit